MKEEFNVRKEEAKREFEYIIKYYMLSLFDNRGNLKFKEKICYNSELIEMKEEKPKKKIVRFYPRIATKECPSPFYCEIGTYSENSLKKPATRILRELLKVSEYCYDNGRFIKKAHYGNNSAYRNSYKKRVMDIAFELGMCQWLTATIEEAATLHSIICRMLEWSSRTYEGKNVPFGIAINFNQEAKKDAADYLHFLENDSSAVFTDGIFSGILLDKNGKILSFLTRNTTAPKLESSKDLFVPYQFSDLARHCVGATVGIVVLANGEILLIKNRAVCFAKRGYKWIYFDWNRVYDNLRPYFLQHREIEETVIKKNIQSIYCTLLDVSFSHTGGCLAIIHPEKEQEVCEKKIITERFDLYVAGTIPEGMTDESKEKANVLMYLLQYSEQSVQSFFEIEKPLRKEILSLDGATVVSLDGSFYCAGSIVAVPSGSSGGGRTAAAKRLANFGVGVKISEDGYIEAYGVPVDENGELLKESKARIIPVFKFK